MEGLGGGVGRGSGHHRAYPANAVNDQGFQVERCP